jgi:hypothetical protein
MDTLEHFLLFLFFLFLFDQLLHFGLLYHFLLLLKLGLLFLEVLFHTFLVVLHVFLPGLLFHHLLHLYHFLFLVENLLRLQKLLFFLLNHQFIFLFLQLSVFSNLISLLHLIFLLFLTENLGLYSDRLCPLFIFLIILPLLFSHSINSVFFASQILVLYFLFGLVIHLVFPLDNCIQHIVNPIGHFFGNISIIDGYVGHSEFNS